MDTFLWVVSIALFSFVYLIVRKLIRESSGKKKLEQELAMAPYFKATQKYIGAGGESCIAVDEDKKTFCLISNPHKNISQRVISYRDILSVEIHEDGGAVTSTSRASQAGGALLGGLALGGVGVLIGGLSGSSKTSNTIERVDSRITVNDTKSPIHDIQFWGGQVNRNSPFYIRSSKEARHWQGLIEVFITKADAEDAMSETEPGESKKMPRFNIK